MVVILTLAPAFSFASDETATYAVEGYGGTGQCNQSLLYFTVDTGGAFSAEFDEWITNGYWYSTEANWNAGVDGPDWIDPVNSGADSNDPFGADHADVAFYAGHGTHWCDTDGVAMYMGDSSYTCTIYTYLYVNLGNSDADIFVGEACELSHLCVWESGHYDEVTSGNLSLWLGFHGISYDTVGAPLDMANWVSSTRLNDVGDWFVDERTDFYGGSNNDQCATAIAWGENSAQADLAFFSGGFDDRPDPGNRSFSNFYYIDGCDPYDGEAL